ncbi:MAG: hypothetical protein EPO07_10275 [Verrucomicrobia bacterium]|nr:MAG: hypothetical protein EPO07_10275 [Verrucomicrobiota bacterium]
MPLKINLRHLEKKNLVLEGEIPAAELDLGLDGDILQANQPLYYELEVQLLEDSLLVRGRLELPLDCHCVRCLKPFEKLVEIDDYASHLPLTGEEATTVHGDFVDLTPILREDILLDLPQHPVCKAGCRGLGKAKPAKSQKSGADTAGKPSTWAELDKLKLNN